MNDVAFCRSSCEQSRNPRSLCFSHCFNIGDLSLQPIQHNIHACVHRDCLSTQKSSFTSMTSLTSCCSSTAMALWHIPLRRTTRALSVTTRCLWALADFRERRCCCSASVVQRLQCCQAADSGRHGAVWWLKGSNSQRRRCIS